MFSPQILKTMTFGQKLALKQVPIDVVCSLYFDLLHQDELHSDTTTPGSGTSKHEQEQQLQQWLDTVASLGRLVKVGRLGLES